MLRFVFSFFVTVVVGAPQFAPPNVASRQDARLQAEEDLSRQLQKDPNNIPLLLRLGSMRMEDAAPLREGDARTVVIDDAQAQFDRVVVLDGKNTKALYSLGVIGWMRAFPALRSARAQLSMDPEAPGPLRDREVRAILSGKYSRVLNDSVAYLERVLEIAPENNDSMAYLNLVYRAKADLEDSADAARQDLATGDKWVHKALETAQAKEASGKSANSSFIEAPPTPPAPPPPPPQAGSSPTRIRVGGNVQASNLVHKVDPVYPMEAKQARIQGTVRFNATIGKDGTIQNLQVVNGQPELVIPAMDAVRQWIYRPTLLNGSPVEVETTVDINFTLAP